MWGFYLFWNPLFGVFFPGASFIEGAFYFLAPGEGLPFWGIPPLGGIYLGALTRQWFYGGVQFFGRGMYHSIDTLLNRGGGFFSRGGCSRKRRLC